MWRDTIANKRLNRVNWTEKKKDFKFEILFAPLGVKCGEKRRRLPRSTQN